MNQLNDNSNKLSKENKAKRALAMREDKARRVQAAKFRRASIMFFAVLLPMIVFALLTLDYLYRPNAFALEELEFSGSFNRVQIQSVEEKTSTALQGNFFTIDLDRIRDHVLSVAWVKDVNVRRKWPNSLTLHVSEYVPHMRWGEDGWVSRSGTIVLDDSLSTDVHVPTLNGDTQYVSELFAFAQLWQKQLVHQGLVLNDVERSSSSAWVISFSHKVLDYSGEEEASTGYGVTTLLLGSEDVQNRLDRFLRMYSQNNILLQASNVVDARYPNGLAIVPIDNSNDKDSIVNDGKDNVVNNESDSNESGAKKRFSSL